jgi:hypothetical protein
MTGIVAQQWELLVSIVGTHCYTAVIQDDSSAFGMSLYYTFPILLCIYLTLQLYVMLIYSFSAFFVLFCISVRYNVSL